MTAELVRGLLDATEKALATMARTPSCVAQARSVFEQVALADDFPTFLTLPAYELLP